MPANVENLAVATWLEKISSFIPIPKKGNAKECLSLHTIALISHSSKEILKTLQARLQHVNHELPDVQAGFRKGRGMRDEIANICWLIKKAREFQKRYLLFIFFFSFFFKHQCLWLCRWPQTVENSPRDGNTRPFDLPPKKSECRTRSNRENRTWNNRLVSNQGRSMSRVYIVTLLI